MNNSERDHWNKRRTIDNYRIRTMTDAQHRAVSLLALYTHKVYLNKGKMGDENYEARVPYVDFFTKAVPTMLHAVGLPELGLTESSFIEMGTNYVLERLNGYLRYIDRKYGTWYAPLKCRCAA